MALQPIMSSRIATLPSFDSSASVHADRLRPASGISRRSLLRGVAGGGMLIGLGLLDVFARARPAGALTYYQDWTSISSGPCGAGNYAYNHTENDKKCGPSLVCSSQGCCWLNSTTYSGTEANVGNKKGWHAYKSITNGSYSQRANECWSADKKYDSWRWRYSDGKTYRCSDGFSCSSSSCTRTICAYAVA